MLRPYTFLILPQFLLCGLLSIIIKSIISFGPANDSSPAVASKHSTGEWGRVGKTTCHCEGGDGVKKAACGAVSGGVCIYSLRLRYVTKEETPPEFHPVPSHAPERCSPPPSPSHTHLSYPLAIIAAHPSAVPENSDKPVTPRCRS